MTAFDSTEIRTALKGADIRVLLMVLFHLTGDRRWLEAPFKPVRDVRLFADESGGLSPELQKEVRDATYALLVDGIGEPKINEPSPELLVEMMGVFSGQNVPAEYVPLVLEEMRFQPRDTVASLAEVPAGFNVLIVGAGVSGLLAAIKLKKLGVPFTVIEKNADVGGTWFENTYPDCRVDTPNHFYSYSFAPNHDWTRYFSPRDEIHGYLRGCSEEFGVRGDIRFNTVVEGARWDEKQQRWDVDISNAGRRETLHASIVISAVGLLNRPAYPDIPGIDAFKGSVFHSARWPDGVDLDGKRIAVIGAGASAMQLVPRVAERAAQLTVYQRSPQWARPSQDYHRAVDDGTRWLLHNLPLYASWYRFGLFWRFSDSLHRSLHVDPAWPHPERSLNKANENHRIELTEYIRSELKGNEELIAKSLPDYPPFGKRILVDNGWYKTLLRDNVELDTDPIERIDATGVVMRDGSRRDFDVVILATGFQAASPLGDVEIAGRGGRTLAQHWGADNPRAYLGMTSPGFPNLFYLYGPNSNLGHGGSIIFVAECQVRYVLGCIEELLQRGAGSIECRPEIHDAYNARVDAAHANMIWTHPGMESYYRNSAGRVVVNSPWRLVDYWNMTLRPDPAAYVFE